MPGQLRRHTRRPRLGRRARPAGAGQHPRRSRQHPGPAGRLRPAVRALRRALEPGVPRLAGTHPRLARGLPGRGGTAHDLAGPPRAGGALPGAHHGADALPPGRPLPGPQGPDPRADRGASVGYRLRHPRRQRHRLRRPRRHDHPLGRPAPTVGIGPPRQPRRGLSDPSDDARAARSRRVRRPLRGLRLPRLVRRIARPRLCLHRRSLGVRPAVLLRPPRVCRGAGRGGGPRAGGGRRGGAGLRRRRGIRR